MNKFLLALFCIVIPVAQSTAATYPVVALSQANAQQLVLITKTEQGEWTCPLVASPTPTTAVQQFIRSTAEALTITKAQRAVTRIPALLLYVEYVAGKVITAKCKSRNMQSDWTWVDLQDLMEAIQHRRPGQKITVRTVTGAWIQLSDAVAHHIYATLH